MAHDVFISYSKFDKSVADAACGKLEGAGIRCWIAPRDVGPGMEWGASIIRAIEQCRVMVLIFSGNANQSQQIRREVERAVNKGRSIITMRIEDVEPDQSLEYFIGSLHWLDALTKPLAQHLARLVDSVAVLLDLHLHPATPPPPPKKVAREKRDEAESPSTALKRPKLRWAIVLSLVVIAIAIACSAVVVLRQSSLQTTASGRRLELALVAADPAKVVGPPLRSYGDSGRTYQIERDITLPGDIERVAVTFTADKSPALLLSLANASVNRINAAMVGREIVLVLDGRSVLADAIVREPVGREFVLSGGMSLDDLGRLVDAIADTSNRTPVQ